MTPYQQAEKVALGVGLDFHTALVEHMERGFVWSSPDCFIMAMESWKDFELTTAETAWFITLAVGDIGQFVKIDPKPDKKWISFARHDGGETHWIPYEKLKMACAKRASTLCGG